MDRRILRKKAKEEYKKMMKSRPKRDRITFEQAYPLLKSMIEHGLTNETMNAEAIRAEAVSTEDEALLAGMMEEAPPPATIETIELSPQNPSI